MTIQELSNNNEHFTIYNLPYGIFSTPTKSKRVGIAIGNYIIDLSVLYDLNFFEGRIQNNVFSN
ncbi:MAG TPA: hypothetical protein PK628_09105, partial [Chitinophagales bacterium]|nr:hypothetical protein [Chitinophagales bacterium]